MTASIEVTASMTETGEYQSIVNVNPGGPWWPSTISRIRLTPPVSTEAQALADGLEVAQRLLASPVPS